jgi:hypothetical protein
LPTPDLRCATETIFLDAMQMWGAFYNGEMIWKERTSRAPGRQLQHDRLVEFLEELEKEKGPIETEILESVRQAWPGTAGNDGDGGPTGTS